MSTSAKMVRRIVILGIAVFCLCTMASAQEQMTATQDPDQHQQYGQWRTMNSEYPRIQTRAKCSYDVKVNGKWTSWWDFQIRSTYQATTDYVFFIEYGNFSTGANTFGAPGLVTAKYESIYTNGTELLGTCHAHPLPNSLFIRVKCAAPTEQELACFKDASGKAIAAAPASGSLTGPGRPGLAVQSKEGSAHAKVYAVCEAFGAVRRTRAYFSPVFPYAPTANDAGHARRDDQAPNRLDTLTQKYTAWLVAQVPILHEDDYFECAGFSTQQEAQKFIQGEKDEIEPQTGESRPFTEVEWPPNR